MPLLMSLHLLPELVMGKSKGIPVAIVRGFDFVISKKASINELIRAREKDLFR